MMIEKINNLRNKFKKYKIDGYIVPKNDDYFSEYAKNDRLKKIAKYNHTTLSNLLEEGAKMIIHRETMKMREDMHDLKYIRNVMSH